MLTGLLRAPYVLMYSLNFAVILHSVERDLFLQDEVGLCKVR